MGRVISDNATYTVGRFRFKNEDEYEAALDDIKIINSFKRKGDITDPEVAKDILESIKRYHGMFETVVGEDFVRQLKAFAGQTSKYNNDDGNIGNSGDRRMNYSITGATAQVNESISGAVAVEGKRYGNERNVAEKEYHYQSYNTVNSRRGTVKRKKGSILERTSLWFRNLSMAKKFVAVIVAAAIIIGICQAGYEVYYRYESYKSLKKLEALAACILEPIEPEVSYVHRQMDVYAGSSGWNLPYEIVYNEPQAINMKADIDLKYYTLSDICGDIMQGADTSAGDNSSLSGNQGGISDILYQYSMLYERNNDLIGWLSIDDTVVNYPVMQSLEDEEYYLKRDFDGEDDINGLPFMDTECDVLKPTSNFMIYGHNMRNGSMFATLLKYENYDFYENHKIIHFDTIYEQADYEIIAVFRTHIAYENEQVFKYYKFFDAVTESEYNSYIEGIRTLAFYDTGIIPEYGEQLLTLSTCDRSVQDGRFVVVARKCRQI